MFFYTFKNLSETLTFLYISTISGYVLKTVLERLMFGWLIFLVSWGRYQDCFRKPAKADFIRLTTAQISGTASTRFNDNLQSKVTWLVTFYSRCALLDGYWLHTYSSSYWLYWLSLLLYYYHILADFKTMMSNKWPIIAEKVMVIFLA